MTIHNLGSINIDLVYRVPHIPAPGETLASTSLTRGLGGKGANMSCAVACTGAKVRHYGAVGPDGDWTIAALERAGVDCAGVRHQDIPTGHAVIQVDGSGENAITLFTGANRDMPADVVDAIAAHAQPGDWLLMQNETAHQLAAAELARANGLKVAYAAAPFDVADVSQVIDHVDLLALNEIEARQMQDALGKPLDEMNIATILVTKGSKGATLLRKGEPAIDQPAFPVTDVVDTTGAGDTFFGVFLGALSLGEPMAEAMRTASAAASIAVGRAGASEAMPTKAEIDAALKNNA